jgi:4-hydroxybenzoate polyprenyltransferase
MFSEYLKLARSFNMALTGLAPVMGAFAMGQTDLFILFLLFVVGCLGHAYGFTHNDIVDYQHDIHIPEIAARPLVRGTISKKQAWVFACGCLLVAGLIVVYLSMITGRYLPLGVFCLPIFCVTLYNYIGKRFPFMDIILAVGMFFLILWAALTQTNDIHQVNFVTWIVCFLGAIQVLYMNIIAGGLKDIRHDTQKGAQTTAVWLGVRVTGTNLFIPVTFLLLAFTLQILNISAVFLPFLFDSFERTTSLFMDFQLGILLLTSAGMLFFVGRLLTLTQFERATVRRLIGIQYYLNFCLAPFLLLQLSAWAIVLIGIPVLGFLLSNMFLHEKFMEPEVM